jgi:hypothetical protein
LSVEATAAWHEQPPPENMMEVSSQAIVVAHPRNKAE